MAEKGEFVLFEHKSVFDIAKFDHYSFPQRYEGPIFTTSHRGIGYQWRIFINPNGAKFRTKLGNNKWSEWEEDRKNVRYHLQFLSGPLSAVNAGFSLKVKPSSDTAAVIQHNASLKTLTLFDLKEGRATWGWPIPTKEKLERDGRLDGRFLTVITEIKMSSNLFDPDYVMDKLKKEIKEEKIHPVSTTFFDSIEEEPAYGVSLKLVVGDIRKEFFCIHQVLEKNSAYFRNLLHSSRNFKENKESKITFFDLNPQGVRAALQYIYLKELPANFKEVAEVCLRAAHLFFLPGLVLECERVLINALSAENDVAMAVLAQTYDLTLLKNMALNSMALRYDVVMKNSRLVNKIRHNNVLLHELIDVVACHARSESGTIV